MTAEPNWLDPREDRAWRAFKHAHHQLAVRLQRHLLQDSGLTEADYEILAVLSEHPRAVCPRKNCALCCSGRRAGSPTRPAACRSRG